MTQSKQNSVQNYWKGKKVLITGASGFIASHLSEALIHADSQVRAMVRTNSQNALGSLSLLTSDVFSSIEVVHGDLRDYSAVLAASEKIDVIFHLGAMVSVPYSFLRPEEVVETNVLGTLNVLMASRERSVSQLIHTSSSEVYGTAIKVPIDEDHPLQGQSPYSASKIGADKLVESFYRSYNLPVITLRPFNTYGPRQSARAVIPTIITQVLTQNVLYLGNLDARRDLTFVDDTVSGFLSIKPNKELFGEVINLGSGKETRIGDLAKKVISILNKPTKIVVQEKRIRPEKSEVMQLVSDNSKALDLLNWKPTISLENGLTKTIGWIQDHLDKYELGKYQV